MHDCSVMYSRVVVLKVLLHTQKSYAALVSYNIILEPMFKYM